MSSDFHTEDWTSCIDESVGGQSFSKIKMKNCIKLLFISLLGYAKLVAQSATQFNSWWANVNSYTLSDKFYLKRKSTSFQKKFFGGEAAVF